MRHALSADVAPSVSTRRPGGVHPSAQFLRCIDGADAAEAAAGAAEHAVVADAGRIVAYGLIGGALGVLAQAPLYVSGVSGWLCIAVAAIVAAVVGACLEVFAP